MPRFFRAANRLDSVLRLSPKLRQKIDWICYEYLRIRENVNYDINANGERWLVEALADRNLLGTAFDVGANHGDWAELVLAANPSAVIHGFEICPPTFQKASARLSGKKNVFLNSFGLSNAAGEIQITYCPDEDGLTTMFKVVIPANSQSVSARVARGDDYAAKQGIGKVDFLKIDVEGAEHLVMEGFGEMLRPATIRVVQFEYGMVNIVTKFLLRDFYALLEGRGYRVGKLFPDFVRFRPYRFEDEDFRGPNYVAVAPEIAGYLEKK